VYEVGVSAGIANPKMTAATARRRVERRMSEGNVGCILGDASSRKRRFEGPAVAGGARRDAARGLPERLGRHVAARAEESLP
jgi:hypothetical protein